MKKTIFKRLISIVFASLFPLVASALSTTSPTLAPAEISANLVDEKTLADNNENINIPIESENKDGKLLLNNELKKSLSAGQILKNEINELLIHAISLVGVKYKFGGEKIETGFDCSGFIKYLFNETLVGNMPRSTTYQKNFGVEVKKEDLQAGDLVFFNTRKRPFSHVGIYLGEGKFIQSPSNDKTVSITDINNSYWKKRYNGARRLIDELSSNITEKFAIN